MAIRIPKLIDKLKFEPPAVSYRAVRPDAVRAEVTSWLSALADLKFEHSF